MSSCLPRDKALEKEDRIDEMKKKNSLPIPHLLQTQQAPALPYAKVPGSRKTPALEATQTNGLVILYLLSGAFFRYFQKTRSPSHIISQQ